MSIPSRPLGRLLSVLSALATLSTSAARAADEPATAAETVQMDAVNIETTRDKAFLLSLPKEAWDWRYGRMGDWEFLSSASDAKTEKMLRDFAEFTSLVHWMIPQWKIPAGGRLRLIICGPRHTFEELRPVASEGSRRDAVTAYYAGAAEACIAVNAGVISLQIEETHGLSRAGGFSTLNQDYGTDSEADITATEYETDDLPVLTLDFLKRDYVRHLLNSQGWTCPAWLTEGLVQLVATAKIEDGRARIGKLDSVRIDTISNGQPSGSGRASELSLFFQGRAMEPLLNVFQVGYDDPAYLNPIGSTFSAQALGFVHYCLYGNDGKQQANFINWLVQLQSSPPTEETFKACFGMSSKQMNIKLRGYFGSGRYASPVTNAETLPEPPQIVMAPADPAMVAAIKAEVHRLAGRTEAARSLLDTALSRGFANAELHDERAQLALDAGDFDGAAAAFAEAAALGDPSDEHRFGLLRLEVMRAPALDSASAKRLLAEALRFHRQVPARTREASFLLAEVFLRSALKPDDAFLNLLDKSAARFRSDPELQAAVTQLHAKVAARQP